MSRLSGLIRSLPLSGRLPSKRAIAAIAKIQGHKLERRWPFLLRADDHDLNLGFQDVLEFQYARTRRFFAVSVGAFDGLENDPIGNFVRNRNCNGILIEPQPDAFARLKHNYADYPNMLLLNAAIDKSTGHRTMYCVTPGVADLPRWTEQLASFDREHLLRHANRAPGLLEHVYERVVDTYSFSDLLERYVPQNKIDVLQVDAEGMDSELIGWFPFEKLRPSVLHYEIAHMSATQISTTRSRLNGYGYRIFPADGPLDDMAILV